jgi:hypothetical protein
MLLLLYYYLFPQVSLVVGYSQGVSSEWCNFLSWNSSYLLVADNLKNTDVKELFFECCFWGGPKMCQRGAGGTQKVFGKNRLWKKILTPGVKLLRLVELTKYPILYYISYKSCFVQYLQVLLLWVKMTFPGRPVWRNWSIQFPFNSLIEFLGNWFINSLNFRHLPSKTLNRLSEK